MLRNKLGKKYGLSMIAAALGVSLSCAPLNAFQGAAPTIKATHAGLETFPTSEATSVPEGADAGKIFSLDNTNHEVPENILNEVSYFSSGGVPPRGCPHLDLTGPTLGFLFRAEELLTDETEKKTIKTCGWEVGEKVSVTVRLPDGTLRPAEYIQAFQDFEYEAPVGIVYYDFVPSPGEFGIYSILFSGKSGRMRHSVFVSSSRVIGLPEVKGDQIGLQGLVPNEKIRIYAYESIPDCQNCMGEGVFHFVAWDEFNADANGELVVKMDVTTSELAEDIFFLAIAEKSGIPRSLSLTSVLEINLDGSCVTSGWTPSEGMPTRLGVGDFAYVTLTPSRSIPLQKDPGKSHESVNKISSGEVVEIIGGPECIDSINWWKVRDRLGNFEGWVPEGDGKYWLVPCSKKNQACL